MSATAVAVAAVVAAVLAVALRRRFGLYVVGVTGSVACGKSTFCDGLRRAGHKVVDLDEIAHQLQQPGDVSLQGRPAWHSILQEYSESPGHGRQSVLLDPVTKAINRAYLSQVVFQDQRKLRALNRIMRRPLIREIVVQIARSFFAEGYKTVFVEAPLLFESGLSYLCDKTITIASPTSEQLERLCKRLSCSESEAEARIAAQMSQSEKVARSDVVIDNSGSKQDLHDRALHLTSLSSVCSKATLVVWIAAVVCFVPLFASLTAIRPARD